MCRFETSFVVTLALLFPMTGWANNSVGFQTALNYPVGRNPRGVAVADFNGDGSQDVAVVNSGDAAAADDGGISILLGNGDGTLQRANNISAGKNPIFLAVGDFNEDGKMDLLVLSPGDMNASPPQPGTISVLSGNGDGTFRSALKFDVLGTLYSVAVADFDGDNHLDFVLLWTPSGGQPILTIWSGNGDGTFRQGSNLTMTAPADTLQVPLVADFNGDHIPDLAERAVADPFNGPAYIDVLLGNGDGTFQNPRTMPAACSGTIVAGDVNRDGRTDLIEEGTCPMAHVTTMLVLLANGDGTFTGSYSAGASFVWQSFNAVLDLDGDGKIDLVALESGPNVLVAPGNGDGSFQPMLAFAGDVDIRLTGVALADLNNDKAPDFVTSNDNNTITVMLNKPGPDFTISAAPPTPDAVTAGQSATSTVTIAMLGAYNSPVFLSCSVQAGQATCSLDQDLLAINPGESKTATLTIHTSATAQAEFTPRPYRTRWLAWLLVAGFSLTGATSCFKGDSWKKLFVVTLAGILVISLLPNLACGGSSNTGGGTPVQRTYTITVTGSAAWNSGPSGLQHSTNVTVTVL